jgi:hypothetical protein
MGCQSLVGHWLVMTVELFFYDETIGAKESWRRHIRRSFRVVRFIFPGPQALRDEIPNMRGEMKARAQVRRPPASAGRRCLEKFIPG